MDVHGTALNDVKAAGGIPLMKEVITLRQRLDHRDCRNVLEVLRGQAGKELATSQRIGDPDCFEFSQRTGHGRMIQSVSRQK
jgi:hypothetical protein